MTRVIREAIAAEGPLPFERFMALALYGEGGYFAAHTLRSVSSGDFLTSPELSPLFGETLAELVGREQARIGEPFALVEVAAGSGSLLRPLLRARPVEAWAVELSPAARAALAELVGAERVVGSLEQIPGPLRGVILANELVDNLPMALARREAAGWVEQWVDREGDGLVFVDAPARPEVEQWLERFAGPVPPGGQVEVQLAAAAWLRAALGRLEAGAIVLFDYGDTAEGLARRRPEGTLRTYRDHHLGPPPLDEPGATDITADVDFGALQTIAREAGARAELWRQDELLEALGLRERVARLHRRERELARGGDPDERASLRALREGAETLLHPRGLGDFRVLVARV